MPFLPVGPTTTPASGGAGAYSVAVADLITDALTELGVLSPGESVQASDQQFALRYLNRLLESWSLERLMLYTITPQSFALTPGKQKYTIGTGGDFDTARPVSVELAVLQINGLELPVDVISEQQWAGITLKTASSSIPAWLYNDGASPLSTLSLYPVPNANASLLLYIWQQFTRVKVTDAIVLPLGYERALLYALALEIEASYDVPADRIAIIAEKHRQAKGLVKSANQKPIEMRCDGGMTQGNSQDSGFPQWFLPHS